ncbi:hypothetical protein DTO166G4_7717 [Paecilomyces variotii]|uniref:MYND-type domain-containing protein n=1 Tax=Byssochlamys spectabilis TaxID=264951 RepID=A0A443I0S6_BYSSP|nr:hypothetical protein C8Q69DRAFT_456225 [Paecilomyces variotii]KAJ9210657.1 hypothetical protein DTO166G4_7717 [Paecilomyces variotii]KAJ9225114.1 hypothetical protein DTO169C6_2455 [Paecilomyces variotii]KAJ9239013.1 hypothetical protein DTO166G5_2543 [Paecilomyces variotii]KAJ9244582.1 hypothetical protein DTO169E5_1800 [Paecilomyces variotii]KAJ9247319.1 hypothetical protein DTO207G8_8198 [Paecilomyces variotii]
MASTLHSPSQYKSPTGSLCRRCAQCSATGRKLLRCSGCRAVHYCNREHQTVHFILHKSVCKQIKKARAILAEEDRRVRNATPDFMTPANAFETHVGHFWGIFNTRGYMRARFELAWDHLLPLGTFDSVHEALEHLLDMLRLCRADNLGIRDIVPAIMLRLDRDQECYDFVKWWATCDPDGDYNWGDMTLPYLNISGADVLEDPGFLLGEFPNLNHIIAVLILNLKLLVDIRNLKITRKILLTRTRLPFELREAIELAVIRSPLSAKFQRESTVSLLKIESELVKKARKLGMAAVTINPYFILPSLLEPDNACNFIPEVTESGGCDEMAQAMQYSYATWWETEGILDLLNDARTCAARDAVDKIEDIMRSEKFKSRPGSDRTAEELLDDLSINRIWPYLYYAVQNASYLGPRSERPSERHTRESNEIWARAKAEGADFEALFGL